MDCPPDWVRCHSPGCVWIAVAGDAMSNMQGTGKDLEPSGTREARTPLPEALIAIGERLRTQDNRITDQPLFLVEQMVRDCGFEDGYCDRAIWVDCEGEEIGELRSSRLESLYDGGRRYRRGRHTPYRRVGVRDRWEYVTACFTEEGCKDYLRRNGHNLKTTRIYADSSYRNLEYQAVRDFLLLAGAPEVTP